ncbi:MAG: hypothetical protein ACI9CP_000157 [Cryomorphaceae bacterium]|jgi:hypothetical protein
MPWGEILLVVIGILIALQINNWNDHRKNEDFERSILELIDQNLAADKEILKEEMLKTTQAIELTELLLEHVAQKHFSDSLNRWMAKIISFERFKSQSSAFEVLKARGIENINDKELQLALISYYDESLFNLSQSIEDVADSFKADWIPIVKQEFSEFKWREYCKLRDQQAFLEKPTTKVLFNLFKDTRGGQLRRMENSLTKINDIRSRIERNTK